MKDLMNHLKFVTLWDPSNPASSDTALVSAIVDTQGFNSLCYNIAYGSISDANATFVVLVEEGDNSSLSDNTTVATYNGTVAAFTPLFSNDNTNFKLGDQGTKRYRRITITPSGNTGDIYLSGLAVLGHADIQPLSTQAV